MASQFKAMEVAKKTQEVREYHADPEQPGKPLWLVIPGGLAAVTSLVAIIVIVVRTWAQHVMLPAAAAPFLMILIPTYIASVFCFSYGYEIYNLDSAISLTAKIVLFTLGVVLIVAVLLALLTGEQNSSSNSSSGSSNHTDSGSASHSHGLASTLFSGPRVRAEISPTNFAVNALFDVATTEGKGVIKSDVSPASSEPVVCRVCQTKFSPFTSNFICPKCGTKAPC